MAGNTPHRSPVKSTGRAAIAAPAAVSVDASTDPATTLGTGGKWMAEADIDTVAGLLMRAISRAATDPATSADKLERLINMHERVTAQAARLAYTAAFADMQHELPITEEHGRIDFADGAQPPYTYALWEDINEVIKPILKKHGFALSFRTGREGDSVIVTGILSHWNGHS
jgi:hypothetical protein